MDPPRKQCLILNIQKLLNAMENDLHYEPHLTARELHTLHPLYSDTKHILNQLIHLPSSSHGRDPVVVSLQDELRSVLRGYIQFSNAIERRLRSERD